jgi:hypothetical protein
MNGNPRDLFFYYLNMKMLGCEWDLRDLCGCWVVFVQTNKFYFLLFISLFEGFSLLIFVLLLFVWEEINVNLQKKRKWRRRNQRRRNPHNPPQSTRPDLPRPARMLFLVLGWRVVIFQPAGCGFGGENANIRLDPPRAHP